MICYIKRKNFINSAVVWLLDENDGKIPPCDIVEYVQSAPRGQNGSDFLSLFTDLTEDEDALFAKIEKQTRYEIRRIAKDNPSADYYGYDELIPPEKLDLFFSDYDSFALSKGLSRIDRTDISNMAKQRMLLLSSASLDGHTLVYHTFVFDRNKARLLNSVSMFRNAYQISANQIGMLNRWLHWKDIQYFKQSGLRYFDWGGINYQNPEIANITKFKKEFGGTEWTTISHGETRSLKGKVYSMLQKIIKNGG